MAEQYIWINTEDVDDKIDMLRGHLSDKEFRQTLFYIVNHTARKVKKVVSTDVPVDYNAAPGAVRSAVGAVRRGGGGDVTCVVPLKSQRWTIGGNHIAASGGVPGWASLAYRGRGYKISAQILQGKSSTLPKQLPHQGGYPPFINTSAPRLNGAVFTRTGRKTKHGKDAIVSVSALAVPQMPLNLSKDKVLEDLYQILSDEVDKAVERLLW